MKKKVGVLVLTGAIAAGTIFMINKDEDNPIPYQWVEGNEYIAQGFGDIEGKRMTNSLEAFVDNYESGYRVFQTNLNLTSDAHVVARQDWRPYTYKFLGQEAPEEYVLNLKHFDSLLIHGKYDSLNLQDIIEVFTAYNDAYLLVEFNGLSNEDIGNVISTMVKQVGVENSVLERIIPVFTNEETYGVVMEQYSFPNVVFEITGESQNISSSIEFLKENGIKVIITSKDRVDELLENEDIKNGDIYVYVKGVNQEEEFNVLKEKGVKGILSDYLNPTVLQIDEVGGE